MFELEGRKLRAVIDTNIWISAWLNRRSVPGVIIQAAKQQAFTALSSRPLQYELKRILTSKFDSDRQLMQRQLERMHRLAHSVHLQTKRYDIPGEKLDNIVIATALDGQANFIVTGDQQHLLPLEQINMVQIITPRQFLNVLRGQV